MAPDSFFSGCAAECDAKVGVSIAASMLLSTPSSRDSTCPGWGEWSALGGARGEGKAEARPKQRKMQRKKETLFLNKPSAKVVRKRLAPRAEALIECVN